MGCLVILLILILATLLAGPLGFIGAVFVILLWALITGSVRLLVGLLSLPFRLLERLLSD
jgi:hypothetical protein